MCNFTTILSRNRWAKPWNTHSIDSLSLIFQHCMKTISCHQSWLVTYSMRNMIGISHSRLVTRELGQPIRNDSQSRITTDEFATCDPWLVSRDSWFKSRVTSHKSRLTTRELSPESWVTSHGWQPATCDSWVAIGEPTCRHSRLKKLYLIGWPNLRIRNR